MTQQPHVVIILPTYNEADNIDKMLPALERVFSQISGYHCSVLVVDDSSPDSTAEQVKKYQKTYDNISLLTGKKQGLGAAYVRGMDYAVKKMNADILFEMDADLSHDPAMIPSFLKALEEGKDMIVGSRYIPGGSIPENWPWYRKVFSVFGNVYVRYGLMLPGVHEWTSGYRALRSDVFLAIRDGLEAYRGYVFQIASLHRAIQRGYRVGEVPIQFVDRTWGTSKIVPYEYIPTLMQYVIRKSSFVRYCIVGGIGFILNVIGLELFYRIGFSPGVAAAIGAEFAIISNFTLNNYWTFSHKKIQRKRHVPSKFLFFNFVALGAILVQGIVVGWGTSHYGDQSRLIFLVFAVGFFVVPYSYFMYNRFIWPRNKIGITR